METIFTPTRKKHDVGSKMIHLVYGNDIAKRQSEVDTLISSYKKQNISFEKIDDSNFSASRFLNTIASLGLFGERVGVIFSHALSHPEIKNFLEENKNLLEETSSPVVFVEGSLLKKDFPSFKKSFTSVVECKTKTEKKISQFNVFSFVDAIASGNKKAAWLLLQEAQKNNISSEELIGPLFWQYKTLTLIATGASIKELGLKPFVYNKGKKLLERSSKEKVQTKLLDLIFLFRDVRNGKDGFVSFEKFILSL